MEVTITLSNKIQENLKVFIEKQTKIHQGIADEWETKGNIEMAEYWRKELTLQEWVHWAFLSAISNE